MRDTPLISFVGDDFTGSTDALESLATAGLRTVLFAKVPTVDMLARAGTLDAFGVATRARSMAPSEMKQTLTPIFKALRDSGAKIVHYKVCSTFDSSPTIGNIGTAIEAGREVFPSNKVPVLVGAPSLGRYCVFGNLFARYGTEGAVFRLDQHPSVSKHPITPMTEADLRKHLAKQTSLPIGLFDFRNYASTDFEAVFETMSEPVVLIDLFDASHLRQAGAIIRKHPFVVGSSGVEEAFAAYEHNKGLFTPRQFPQVKKADGPVLVLCGSCSPVSIAQIEWAKQNGFAIVGMDDCDCAVSALKKGRHAVIHTNAAIRREGADAGDAVATSLANAARRTIDQHRVNRIIIAGGDTSGTIAQALGIESMEMSATLVRGSPLCRVTAPYSPADNCEITFKGGQIGSPDFFGLAANGASA